MCATDVGEAGKRTVDKLSGRGHRSVSFVCVVRRGANLMFGFRRHYGRMFPEEITVSELLGFGIRDQGNMEDCHMDQEDSPGQEEERGTDDETPMNAQR